MFTINKGKERINGIVFDNELKLLIIYGNMDRIYLFSFILFFKLNIHQKKKLNLFIF